MKNKICNIILVILVIAFISIVLNIGIKYTKHRSNEEQLQDVVKEFKSELNTSDEETKEIKLEYNGYNVVGIINIPKLGIEFPILDITNDDSMKVSVTKFWGNNVNDIGNFTIVGHNNLDGTMFSNTKKLKIGDEIILTDLSGKTLRYRIFDKYIIEPNDVSCTESVNKDQREVTLITCTNGRRNRLVIKANEII